MMFDVQICLGFWILYFFATALLVMIYIPYKQNWAGGHRCSLRHNVCRPAITRTLTFTILYIKYYYKCEYNIFCVNTHTPPVAATSFFAGEVEIFDFVTERAKRCIAATVEKKLNRF